MARADLVVGVHLRGAETGLFQSLEDEGIPREYPVITKKRVSGVGSNIFLAGRKVRGDIDFRPEAIRDSLASAGPAVELAGDITAELNSHPTAAVVVDAVHGVVGVIRGKGIADHRVPRTGEV